MTEKLPNPRGKVANKSMFAIQHVDDKKWSKGGSGPSWAPFPKTWGIGPFKNHLLMFAADDWTFNVTRVKKQLAEHPPTKNSEYYFHFADPDYFQTYKLIHSRYFPYERCEVVEFDPNTLAVIQRYPAMDWIWENCYKPHYEKSRYVDQIKEWCKEFGKDF